MGDYIPASMLLLVVSGGTYIVRVVLRKCGTLPSQKDNRDFAEYFLIGSLSSVLVALCAGLGLRFALLQLWPDLLGLQMQ
ncbi:MAG TPA: hypothetical protein VJX69_03390 [Terriglobales bacterium]|nr:hypothetical protein [Terriglobales bacterium]